MDSVFLEVLLPSEASAAPSHTTATVTCCSELHMPNNTFILLCSPKPKRTCVLHEEPDVEEWDFRYQQTEQKLSKQSKRKFRGKQRISWGVGFLIPGWKEVLPLLRIYSYKPSLGVMGLGQSFLNKTPKTKTKNVARRRGSGTSISFHLLIQ